jgi:hypothetical protein
MLPNRAENLKPLPQNGAVKGWRLYAPTLEEGVLKQVERCVFDLLSRKNFALLWKLRNPWGFPGDFWEGALTQRAAFASATVNAVMLMMRRTVAEGVRMCTGCAAPSSTGPIAMPPPAAVFNRL